MSSFLRSLSCLSCRLFEHSLSRALSLSLSLYIYIYIYIFVSAFLSFFVLFSLNLLSSSFQFVSLRAFFFSAACSCIRSGVVVENVGVCVHDACGELPLGGAPRGAPARPQRLLPPRALQRDLLPDLPSVLQFTVDDNDAKDQRCQQRGQGRQRSQWRRRLSGAGSARPQRSSLLARRLRGCNCRL